MTGWMYILECSDGSYYIVSTRDIERRMFQHQKGEGAQHTKKDYPLNWFILKFLIELIMHFTERSKFKVGVEKRKRH